MPQAVLRVNESKLSPLPPLVPPLLPAEATQVRFFMKEALHVEPPPSMKFAESEIVAEFERAGFKLSKRLNSAYQCVLFLDGRT